MKNVFLTAAVVTTLVGNAFGAASLRAPQLGGGATATPATTATTARAGTMRAQTMKTSMSTSVAAPTTTASISEPVATGTTDARLSFLKSVKGFNPGKVKDTTTTQQELNSIDSRIEELQSKLDAAESAQATVLTESNIDAKITEKLTALGTAPANTYSKTEIDNLLNEIKSKLPIIDNDRGTINMIDPNGTLVSYKFLRYWLATTNEEHYWPFIRSSYVYRGNPSNTTWQTWENEICQSYSDKFACCIDRHTDDSFHTYVILNGYKANVSHITTLTDGRQVLQQEVTSCQYTDTESLRSAVCGDTPIDECWIEGNNSSNFVYPCGISSCYSGIIYRPISSGNNNPRYNLMSTDESPQVPLTNFWYTIYPLDVAVSNETYEEWESALCEPYSDEPACCLQPYHDPNYGYDNTFHVYVPHNGYKLSMPMGPQIVTLSNGKRALKLAVTSFQYTDTASIQTAVCGTATTNECWIEEWENHGPNVESCGLSMYDGYAYWTM